MSNPIKDFKFNNENDLYRFNIKIIDAELKLRREKRRFDNEAKTKGTIINDYELYKYSRTTEIIMYVFFLFMYLFMGYLLCYAQLKGGLF